MHVLFSPAIRLMNRLKYPQKFLLISLLFALPLAFVLSRLNSSIGDNMDIASKEIQGNAYLRPCLTLLRDVPQEKRIARQVLAGRGGTPADVQAADARIAADLQAVSVQEDRLGGRLKRGSSSPPCGTTPSCSTTASGAARSRAAPPPTTG